MSLAVVFDRGDEAGVLAAVLDDDSCGQWCARLVSALLARLRIVNEEAYLLAVDDVLGFLEASARPVPVGRVVLNRIKRGYIIYFCRLCFLV